LVLPAELLTTNYAAEVRSFLLRRFGRVRLMLFTERVFPGVLEEVLLLTAEGAGPTDRFEIQQLRDAEHLLGPQRPPLTWRPADPGAKWTPALLEPKALEVFGELSQSEHFTTLHTWGETTLGAVTGNNAYFALTDAEITRLGLTDDDLVRLSPPGSRHLRRLSFGEADWEDLRGRDGRVWLFRPRNEPTGAAGRYIAAGEREGVHRAYKCRVRDPWWRTPIVPPPDLFVTYMNADTPRITTNAARVHHLNSVHGIYLRPEFKGFAATALPIAALNSVTLVGAEIVGRAYGGGMLKLEPREADLLPLPSPVLVADAMDRLSGVLHDVVGALAVGDLLRAVRFVDRALFKDGLGVGRSELSALENARAALTARRVARGRAQRRAQRG
jgi:hypothetical protein